MYKCREMFPSRHKRLYLSRLETMVIESSGLIQAPMAERPVVLPPQ